MGYRIIYKPSKESTYPHEKRAYKKFSISIIVLVAVIGLACIAGLNHNEEFKKFLFVGNYEINKIAIAGMVEDVRSGEPVVEAFSTFCREIINSAK